MQDRSTLKTTLLKQYLVKRTRMREQVECTQPSIFSTAAPPQFIPSPYDRPFQKYQTLTTNVENSVVQGEDTQENVEMLREELQQPLQQSLPKIEPRNKIALKSYATVDSADTMVRGIKLRLRDLSQHRSEPFYLRIEKTVAKRVRDKFNHYSREWLNASSKRKARSILDRSYLKAAEITDHVRRDASNRRNGPHLEQMLRNQSEEKVYVDPGVACREIEGLKGRGGRAMPIFEEVYMVEEVYKRHSVKQHS